MTEPDHKKLDRLALRADRLAREFDRFERWVWGPAVMAARGELHVIPKEIWRERYKICRDREYAEFAFQQQRYHMGQRAFEPLHPEERERRKQFQKTA